MKMNMLELRILAERLFEAVKGEPATPDAEDERALKRIEEILKEELNNDL